MRASDAQVALLLEHYGIAPPAVGGSDSLAASQGGRVANIRLLRDERGATLEFTIDRIAVTAQPPQSFDQAESIIKDLRAKARLPEDRSFEHMLAHLLLKATALFDECEGARFELRSLHLHPSSYHIGAATLVYAKPFRVKRPLDGKSHDVHSVFSGRHGGSRRSDK